VARIDAARFHAAMARLHLAAGRPADAWAATRTADRLVGPGRSFVQYALEAHAGVPEVCLALLERDGDDGADPAELRTTAAAGLRRYARAFPMARPRAWSASAGPAGRTAARPPPGAPGAGRSARPNGCACPTSWPGAHHELGRHLAAGERSSLGLDRAGHLERALAGFPGGRLRRRPAPRPGAHRVDLPVARGAAASAAARAAAPRPRARPRSPGDRGDRRCG
jgi:hypothetical protein